MIKKKTCDSCYSTDWQGGERDYGVCGHCANSYSHEALTDTEWADFEALADKEWAEFMGDIPACVDNAQEQHYPEPF